jgi:hypothetical protein
MIKRCALLLSASIAVVAGGCGQGVAPPPLAALKGKVLVDGRPVPGLIVVYEPEASGATKAAQAGSTSVGRTDAEGNFELRYRGGEQKGAVPGTHVVRVIPIAGGGPAGGENADVVKNPIPPQYNTQSTIRRVVKLADNPVDEIRISTR